MDHEWLQVDRGAASAGSDRVTIVVPAGGHVDAGHVTAWSPSAMWGTIESQGKAVEGATLTLLDGSKRTTTTDAKGEFRFSNVGPGRVQFEVLAPGHAPFKATGYAGARVKVAF